MKVNSRSVISRIGVTGCCIVLLAVILIPGENWAANRPDKEFVWSSEEALR